MATIVTKKLTQNTLIFPLYDIVCNSPAIPLEQQQQDLQYLKLFNS